MTNRYHCEFKDCMCIAFIKDKSSRCNDCKHGDVWHSRLNHHLMVLQFYSVRESARKPEYTSVASTDISNNFLFIC